MGRLLYAMYAVNTTMLKKALVDQKTKTQPVYDNTKMSPKLECLGEQVFHSAAQYYRLRFCHSLLQLTCCLRPVGMGHITYHVFCIGQNEKLRSPSSKHFLWTIEVSI